MKEHQVLIYVKNQYNERVGVFSFNNKKFDGCDKTPLKRYDSIIKDYSATEDRMKNNIHSKITTALFLECLKNESITINLVKCVKRTKSNLVYLIRINGDNEIEKFNFCYFDRCFEKSTVNYISKAINKYVKGNKRKVLTTKLSSMGIGFFDVIIGVISGVVMALSIIKIIEGSKEYSLLFSISLLMSLLQLLSILTKKIARWKAFCLELDLVSMTDTISKEEIIKNATTNKSKKYNSYTCLDFKKDNGSFLDCFLISDEENKNLKENATKIKVELCKFKHSPTKDSRRALANVISTKLSQDKYIFNGKLLGIASDLNFKGVDSIQVQKVRYNDYVSLDEMIYKNIMLATEPTYFFKGSTACINPETKALKDIEKSPLTNLIGVNLLLECVIKDTNEKYIVINEQSTYNDVNGGKLVPTSSGSLEQKDYTVVGKKNRQVTLFELLKRGMYRELVEESYINEEFLSKHQPQFSIIGVSRLISKGGKPDFFGKCSIYITKEESKEILKNFNACQVKYIGTKNTVESNSMLYIDKKIFLNSEDSFLYACSAQLQYFHYLLNKEREIEKN